MAQRVTRTTLTFKSFNRNEKVINVAKRREIEKCLVPIWSDNNIPDQVYQICSCGSAFSLKARQHSVALLATGNAIFPPSYLGRRASRVSGDEIPSEVGVTWLVAAIVSDLEEKVTILQAVRLTA